MRQLIVGADTMPLGWLGGLLTAVFLACFLGWAWWAYRPANRARHEASGRIPFEGEER